MHVDTLSEVSRPGGVMNNMVFAGIYAVVIIQTAAYR
jgi:hypothetical protein